MIWACSKKLRTCQNESAGKRKSSKTRKGNQYLRSALTEAAQSIRESENYFGAQYRRIAARKGKRRAAVAVAHSSLTIY
ncbi:transposase [Paenibacillus mesophilus]|uniref:transposase n=1 Tax=Paenibacillus mesophilus TaxID=2582849 RepID=UPI001EE43BF4|nr:transposase [Paenibacillus mesophilus]